MRSATIMQVLITGAAGNLGSILARHLLNESSDTLRLMIHRKDVSEDLRANTRTQVVRADLADISTLPSAVSGADVIVHFAGVLFKARPERFLPKTNAEYFTHLVDAASAHGVKKLILISFPHVEGPTSVDHPATGRLDGDPISVHAKTRLEEEKYLFANVQTPISLRVGMVYGNGILMTDTARWLARRRLLGVWRERTQIHLISKDDFCRAVAGAIHNPTARGIYHLGDDGIVSLQEFMSIACEAWKTKPPWRMPLWMIYTAARLCELYSFVFNARSLLTKDFIDIGRVSYYGNTSRMKADLLSELRYPSILEGIRTLADDSR